VYKRQIRDVITIIFEGGRIKRQQPEGVDPQVLEIIELLDHAAEVTDPIADGIPEGFDRRFVNDGIFVPQRIIRQRRKRIGHGILACKYGRKTTPRKAEPSCIQRSSEA
jgi:hypothetical protein